MPKIPSVQNPGGSSLTGYPHGGGGGAASMPGWGRDLGPEGKNVGVPEHGHGHSLQRKFTNQPGLEYRGKDAGTHKKG